MLSWLRARTWLALALVLALAGSALAQQTESRIIGKVVDQSEAALPGVTVNVLSKATGAVRTVVTEGDGSFVVTNLSPGAYSVVADLSGFQTYTRDIVLGVGQVENVTATLGVGGVSETVSVSAVAPVLDVNSAKIGVNVSPEEVQNLPVNGRNFANLMTLATGATSDGNGGWASVRFNGKSNQQNYLNYDGVDGTYVWDASPGYLNATGSQFRLQTSMESVAEFRVNSGLAPAESGLGSGGNITVVSKSGSNRFTGSIFEYKRDDALDAASKYDNVKQPLTLDQFGGSFGGPVLRNRSFFFFSYEGLRQTTGLSFAEAVPSAEARRRILAGEPIGSGNGQSAARTLAVAPLLAGFPLGTTPTANPLLDLAVNNTEATQQENTLSLRFDQTLTKNHSFYARYLFSDGRVDTPDRTATPRRVLARQRPQNFAFNFQSLVGTRAVNELKLGINMPQNSARAFGPAGYDPIQVSLSGNVTSGSIDARGTTGIARSGLLIRGSSAVSTNGLSFDPRSISLSDALTYTRGTHTFKFGGEYRQIESEFQFLGSTEITYNSINDFIDNRPAQLAVAVDSPFFVPQQYYAIGFVQDSWRASDRLTLELGLRYDFYSVVKEKNGLARPFFVEDNAFATDPDNFYDADRNNFAPRLSAAFELNPRTVVRGGFGIFYGPGQFEDRIQPIENYIERRRVQNSDVPANALAYPIVDSQLRNLLSIRGYTHKRPDEYNVQYGASLSRELPGAINLTVGYTGSQGKDMFLRGVANTLDLTTRTRPVPSFGQIDYKTSGCLDGLVIDGNAIQGCGYASYNALQLSATRRFRSGFTGGFQYQYSKNRGTTQGSNEAATSQNTFDYATEYGTNPQDIPHTFNGSLVYQIPGDGLLKGGWRVGGILNARSGVPINVTINRNDNTTVAGRTVVNIPGGNSRGTQRPDLVPGVDPYLENGGVRYLNPAAFATPMPGTFGNLPRNFLRGPSFSQVDLMFSKDLRFGASQGLQVRVELFNILNRLNYESPAA
ncbi:MAG: carboxypeptidase regulatory-like domain-containing protein, partial [Vicinamibacterales bacterium]